MFEKLKDGEFCPLIRNACITHKCKWYKKILGTNPQTGQAIEEYDCAIAMLPILLIENAMVGRQTGAEVQAVRKETIKQRTVIMAAMSVPESVNLLKPPENGDEPNGQPQ